MNSAVSLHRHVEPVSNGHGYPAAAQLKNAKHRRAFMDGCTTCKANNLICSKSVPRCYSCGIAGIECTYTGAEREPGIPAEALALSQNVSSVNNPRANVETSETKKTYLQPKGFVSKESKTGPVSRRLLNTVSKKLSKTPSESDTVPNTGAKANPDAKFIPDVANGEELASVISTISESMKSGYTGKPPQPLDNAGGLRSHFGAIVKREKDTVDGYLADFELIPEVYLHSVLQASKEQGDMNTYEGLLEELGGKRGTKPSGEVVAVREAIVTDVIRQFKAIETAVKSYKDLEHRVCQSEMEKIVARGMKIQGLQEKIRILKGEGGKK